MNTCATSITISLVTSGCENYLQDVTNLIVGNMVSPMDCNTFWAGPFNANPWTWVNDGSNCNAFGLLANYNYVGQSNPGEKTAFGELVINPTLLGPGNYTVIATLCTAAIGGAQGNTILMFESATVDGKPSAAATVANCASEPLANCYTCN